MYAVRTTDVSEDDLPFTVEELKKHLRIPLVDQGGTDEEDELLTKYLISAFVEAENATKRRLSNQVWHIYPDEAETTLVLADYSPVRRVEGPYNSENQLVAGYTIEINFVEPERVTISGGDPGADGLYFKVTCGYESSEKIPEPILQWIRMRVSTYNEHRETDADKASDPNKFANALLAQQKVWRF